MLRLCCWITTFFNDFCPPMTSMSDNFYPRMSIFGGLFWTLHLTLKSDCVTLSRFRLRFLGPQQWLNLWMRFYIIDHSVPSADIWIRYIKTFHRKKEFVRFFMFRCRLFYIICFILLPYVPNRTAVVAICKVLRIDMKVNTIVLITLE